MKDLQLQPFPIFEYIQDLSFFFAQLPNFTESVTNYNTDVCIRTPRDKHLYCRYLKLGRLNRIHSGYARLLP